MESKIVRNAELEPKIAPPEVEIPAADEVIESAEIGRIVEVQIAAVNADRQAEIEKKARVANGD